MIKVAGLLIFCNFALAIPFPGFVDQQLQASSINPSIRVNSLTNTVTAERNTKTTGKDSVLSSGSAKRLDIDGESRLIFNGHDNFIPLFRPPTGAAFQPPEQQNENTSAEVAATRAVETPLFFDTFEHSHMVTNYAERRQVPLLFRSIRPDFPWSDIQTGRRSGN